MDDSKIKLSEEAKARLVYEMQRFILDEFDEEYSEFKVERLVEFFTQKIGAPVYNQAVQDARKYMMMKLDDLEGDLYEPVIVSPL